MSVKLEVRTNRHPNLNGEPWGWVSGLAGMSIHWDGKEGRANADALASAHARALAAESARDETMALLADAVSGADEQRERAERAESDRDEAQQNIDHVRWQRDRWETLHNEVESARDAALRERDDLRRHFDAAAPEHNLPALLDLYLDRQQNAERERDQWKAQAETDAAHHAAARAAHADLLRNHRAAMEGALEEIGRLRGAIEAILVEAEAKLRAAWGTEEPPYAWVYGFIKGSLNAAVSSTTTVSVEPSDEVDASAELDDEPPSDGRCHPVYGSCGLPSGHKGGHQQPTPPP